MIERKLLRDLLIATQESPAVVLLGPRQVGKTTLAFDLSKVTASIYLDLQSETDLSKLTNAEMYLAQHQDKLVIFDEVHRLPGLFPVLRGLIDRARRAGRDQGLYLLLGSASLELLKQSGESLAGRVRFLELSPLNILEILAADISTAGRSVDSEKMTYALWVRGGVPQSYLAKTEAKSLAWRRDFIRTYLERDIPQFAPRIAAETLRRFWSMLAHAQGGLLNAAELASSLSVDVKTVQRYLDLLVDLLLVRRLMPWHSNLGKRLVKSPKVYLRDSGLLHALLGLNDLDALLGHSVCGLSYEGFVLENILACTEAAAFFYRSSAGAEIDLLLNFDNGELWAIEVKRSVNPKPRRGFYQAIADLKPSRSFVVYPGQERFQVNAEPLAWQPDPTRQIEAISLPALCLLLRPKNLDLKT